MRLRTSLLATGLCLLAFAAPANAALITGLVNTGTNIDFAGQDLNYALVSSPGSTYSAAYQLTVSGFPFPFWIANTGTSSWIVPGSSTTTSHVAGLYVYSLQFNVAAETNLSSISIGGRWSTDNNATMSVNGGPTVSTTALTAFTGWQAFTINAGNSPLTTGLNTITFSVTNAAGTSDNPTGLRVEFTSVEATAVPEPSTLGAAALAIGLGAFAGYRRRLAK